MWGTPLSAQGREIGVQAIGTTSDPALGVGALYGGIRTSNRTRLSATVGAGLSSGEAAYRGEIMGQFLLSPNKRVGSGLYLGGGVAAVGGPVERGYLVLYIGMEGRPGGTTGWAAEVGIGGGLRLALGYRWRRLRSGRMP
jgi:hypothetical protein